MPKAKDEFPTRPRQPTVMSKPNPVPPPSHALMARLNDPMLALHSALDTDALWKAILELIRTAVPSHRVTLFLGHLGMGEARVVLTDPPIARSTEWYAERGKANPFTPFIEANRGRRFYRFEEVLPPRREWLKSEFYRRFACEEGWDKGLSMAYWSQREVTAMFSLYRAPEEKTFTKLDEAVLYWLYPYIGTAIARVQRLHTERLARRSLEEFNRHLPVGLLLLSWELKAEFTNQEGQRQCLFWNHGPTGGRSLNPSEAFKIPPHIFKACTELKASVQARNPKTLTLLPSDIVAISHPSQLELRAQVSLHNTPGNALAHPRFLVVLDTRPSGAQGEKVGGNAVGERFGALRELTPREREIAMLVYEGFSNAEIAQRLSKSVLTIKTQLNSVFRKLGVKSRTRLIALLR